MIYVDGNKTGLHLNCMGSGEITFILGKKKKFISSFFHFFIFLFLIGHSIGGSSQDWRWIQPTLSNFTRVCSYDRAGYGWYLYFFLYFFF
jgi:pimeloyl-ACP methyl ester carboxylesterase